MARRIRIRDTSEEATFDLNLAPMMDMLVSIIPFMLLSVTFLHVMIIEAPLPQVVAQALAQDREAKKREVAIEIRMTKAGGFFLEVHDEAGKVTKSTIAMSASEFDYKNLHKRLIEVKQQHPKVFRLELNPDENISYQDVVKAMDAARTVEKTDPKIMIDGAETPLMFPDVILANVMS